MLDFFRRPRAVVGLALAGAVLALGAAWLRPQGAFLQWQRLPAMPEMVVSIRAADSWTVFVATDSGAIWRCTTGSNADCWSEVSGVSVDTTLTTRPCDWRDTAQLPTTRPPADLVECIWLEGGIVDGYGRFAYARDRDGGMWSWGYMDSAYGVINDVVTWPMWGCGGGLVVGLGLALAGGVGRRRNVWKARP